MSITIFSRPIHSGKTTELLHWCSQQKNIAGILMPDIDGKRKVLDLRSGVIADIECDDPLNTKEALIQVGRYYFYSNVFEKINSRLPASWLPEPGWMIIDEVGKLELEGKGFYPLVKKMISDHENKGTTTNLLLVIRDSICDEVISRFNINTYTLIHGLEGL